MQQKLDYHQLSAARRIAQGQSTSAVALDMGQCRSTIWRWSKLPVFQRAVKEFQEQERLGDEQERIRVRHKLECIADACIETLWEEVRRGPKRLDLAMYLLKMMGIEDISALMPPVKLPQFKDCQKNVIPPACDVMQPSPPEDAQATKMEP